MSALKIVILILLVLGLLYLLSFAVGVHIGGGSKDDVASFSQSLSGNSWAKSLTDRFGQTLDLALVKDAHLSAADRTFTVPAKQTTLIRIPSTTHKSQILKPLSGSGTFDVVYAAATPKEGDTPKPQELKWPENPDHKDDSISVIQEGGVLTISCQSAGAPCTFKIK